MSSLEVLVPVKSFAEAKQRLSPVLSLSQRQRLMQAMAKTVLAAAEGLPCHVVCEDDDVRAWASGLGVRSIIQRCPTLNESLQLAARERQRAGVQRLIIAHGDLPLASSFSDLLSELSPDSDEVHIVSDRSRVGTKVLSVPTKPSFIFSYGPNSAALHTQQAAALGLACSVVNDPKLSWDINTPKDLFELRDHHPQTFQHLMLHVSGEMAT